MNKKSNSVIRMAAIGVLHAVVFLWVIPRVIVPLVGSGKGAPATIIVIALTVAITTAILFYPAFRRYRNKK